MNIKSFYSLTGRCPMLTNGLSRYSRNYYSINSNEKYRVLSHFIPVQIIQQPNSLLHIHSYFANQEKLSKENMHQNLFEIPSLQFEDVSFEKPVSHEELMAELHKYETIADQIACLERTLSLSTEDIQKRIEFCKTIESLFQPFFNDFKIQMFGSTVNCYGFKGCDIDMTFETSNKHKNMSHYLERPDVPLICEVLSGKVSLQELSELPPKEQLIFMHSVFLEHYKESEIPAKFINAHVPLIRFYHDKFNLKCDLTMKNRVAYANTKLLYLYGKLDKRVRPLVMTLRYWAKHTELIGKGLMFNTYTITLLVMYFLQTRSPPILPTAEFVLSLTDKFDTDMDDQTFLDIMKDIPCSENKQTLEELLEEFFFFYLYFDFTRVIRPLTASADLREEFFSKKENHRFRMNTICIQDPLCLTHNVAELVDYKHCRKFFNEIMIICKLFQKNKFTHPISRNFNLITLLEKSSNFAPLKEDKSVLSISIPLISKRNNHLVQEEEILSSAKNLLHILQHALLFDCRNLEFNEVLSLLELKDKLVSAKKIALQERAKFKFNKEDLIPHFKNRYKKTDEVNEDYSTEEESGEGLLKQFRQFNSDHKLVLCAECKVTKNTWVGRESVILDSLQSTGIFDTERLISEYVAKQNALYIEKKMKPFIFLLECYISINSSEDLLVNFRPLNISFSLQRMSFNPVLGIFLKEYLTKFMKKCTQINDLFTVCK